MAEEARAAAVVVVGAHRLAEAELERPGEAGDNVGADLAAAVAMRSPADEVEQAHVPAEAGEVEVARDRVAPPPVVVAGDFVAELPAALEGAEALAAAREVELGVEIDRQPCHLAAMSLETDRVEVEIVRVASVDQEVLQIVRVASVDRVESGTVRAALEDQEVSQIGLVASVGQVVLPIGLESIAPEPELAIDPELTIAPALEIDPVSEVPLALALGLVSEQGSRIDPELGTAHSSEIALGTAATESAIVLVSRTTAVTASKIAGIVLQTVRRTAAIGSRTVATDLKIAVIALRTGAIG